MLCFMAELILLFFFCNESFYIVYGFRLNLEHTVTLLTLLTLTIREWMITNMNKWATYTANKSLMWKEMVSI